MTLTEVARRAEVSPTTASFVLNGRLDMRISEDARQRVLRAAHELGYRPNLVSRGLRTKITHTVALVSDTIATEPYAGEIVHGSLAAAVAREHLLYVGETEDDPEVEARLIEHFLDRQVDGFVYATMFTRGARVPKRIQDHPLVLLNCTADGLAAPSVLPHEREAGRSAATALLDAGHREGIYLVGEQVPGVFAASERHAGINEVLHARGADLAGLLPCRWWPESGFEAVSEFLRSGRRPRALICYNDRIALGAYQALQEAGLGVPTDTSVVSFDDSDLASWLRPKLTSVALPHYEMGRIAVELLLSRSRGGHDGDGGGYKVVWVPMPLRERASVGPPSR
ncbi:LacI family DNA-binding transcriptional regulator [Pseudonocardia bannensis]|uniref:Substrate-binding domain-containing protein n=1 Tax=Pseudonocardia bannensis TaxID=630973 RepID=A0A848DDB5_9PSEU|nr:LacI family DNA-binding transcriptional regulator [Pseudonocardia bannensis]NMH90575.1 substrate-binding domain-containing protein [Pseudonocardia bannensis]